MNQNKLQELLKEIKDLSDDNFYWVGIYWVESFVKENGKTNELVLGPFFGPNTPHTRISFEKGLCGLSMRKQSEVYVENVKKDDRYLACNSVTESEFIVPLRNKGQIVGQIDIDCTVENGISDELKSAIRNIVEKMEGHL